MRKLILFLSLTLGLVLASNGQKGVFPYNHPSKGKIFSLAISNTPKGIAYKDQLLKAINIGLADTTLHIYNVEEIFPHLYSDDVTLLEASYINSGYDEGDQKMEESLGHSWSGFAWFYKIGTYSICLIKGDCGNVLIVKPIRIKLPDNPPPKKDEPKPNLYNPNLFRQTVAPPNLFQPIQKTQPPPNVKKGKAWPWIVAGIIVGGVASYLAFRGGKSSSNPRTEPGGLPSDPRTMPGGLGP